MVIQPLNLRGATMENEELRKLQLYQLDILKGVNCICQKHHIKYYISWGSLLGAVVGIKGLFHGMTISISHYFGGMSYV